MGREGRATAVERKETNVVNYLQARTFLEALRRNRGMLSQQQYRTLKGQALSGDVEGAIRGLERILRGETRFE